MPKALARFAFLLFICPLALAKGTDSYRKIVQDSFTSFEKNDRKAWAYSLAKQIGSGKKRVTSLETFDPSLPQNQQWVLVKEYDKPPSPNRIAEYKDQKVEQLKAEEAANAQKQTLLDMVNLDSLQVLGEENHLVTLSFTPNLANMGPQSSEKLTGLLILDTEKLFVRSMKISNIDEFSPANGVTLGYFSMAFAFIMQDNVMLPQNITIDISGKMAFARPITQHSSETYSDYRFVGDKIEAMAAK